MRRTRLNREQKRALTRQQLLRAAGRVFARQGFHGASLEGVAEEAGFSKGAVYSNFEDKEDLFLSLLEEHARAHLRRITESLRGAGAPEDLLARGARLVTDLVAADRDWCLLSWELWAYSVRNPKLRRRYAAYYEECRAGLAEGIEEHAERVGLVLTASPDEVASTVMAVVDGFMVQRLADPKRYSDEAYGSAAMRVLAGLVGLSDGAARDVRLAGVGAVSPVVD